MSYFGGIEKTMIFSEHDWIVAKNNKKLNILKTFEKEIAKDFGIKSKPQLLLSQNTDVLGSYSSDSNTLEISESLLLKGSQCQMPRPVKGSGLAKGSCPIQFQRLTACPCGPNVSLPHYAFACIPRYRGLRLHRRAIDRARLFILPAEADSMPVS